MRVLCGYVFLDIYIYVSVYVFYIYLCISNVKERKNKK